MKTKGYWVIKTSAGGYWNSSNFDPQLRKAHIYTWKEKAEEQIQVMIKRKYLPADITYEIIAVAEPKELKDTEAVWDIWEHSEEDEPIYVCSNCGLSALNDYRGRSTASKFCPHCGKRMINSTIEED